MNTNIIVNAYMQPLTTVVLQSDFICAGIMQQIKLCIFHSLYIHHGFLSVRKKIDSQMTNFLVIYNSAILVRGLSPDNDPTSLVYFNN